MTFKIKGYIKYIEKLYWMLNSKWNTIQSLNQIILLHMKKEEDN